MAKTKQTSGLCVCILGVQLFYVGVFVLCVLLSSFCPEQQYEILALPANRLTNDHMAN